jgi:hypothetical protein
MSVIGILAIAACWVAICEVLVWLYQLDLPEPHAEIGDFSSSLTRVSCCRCAKSTRRQGDKATRRQGDKATRRQGRGLRLKKGSKSVMECNHHAAISGITELPDRHAVYARSRAK